MAEPLPSAGVAAAPAVAARGLGRDFDGVPAVRSLDLTIERGEMFGLVGPDGAGKSTTLRMLCGILRPSAGHARVLGFDLAREAAAVKDRIGYFSQRFSLYGDLTVDENIEFFAEIHGVRDFRARREELLAFTRLGPFRGRLAERLSGGMKQKLALACTLVHTPSLLLLDEPTTGVDPVSRRDFWKILSGLLHEGITILMTTPYLDEAERCSRVGLISEGRLLAVDTPAGLRARMPGRVVEVVCPEVRRAAATLRPLAPVHDIQTFGDRLNLVVDDPDAARPLVLDAMSGAGIPCRSWREVPPRLENVFIAMVESDRRGASHA